MCVMLNITSSKQHNLCVLRYRVQGLRVKGESIQNNMNTNNLQHFPNGMHVSMIASTLRIFKPSNLY